MKLAKADDEGLTRLEEALANRGAPPEEPIRLGTVEPNPFARLRRLNSRYRGNTVLVDGPGVKHLYDRRIIHSELTPGEVSGIVRSLLDDPNPITCESTRAFMKAPDADPNGGIREVLTNRRDEKLMNFGVFTPDEATGNPLLITAYLPEAHNWQRWLYPGRKAMREFKAYLKKKNQNV